MLKLGVPLPTHPLSYLLNLIIKAGNRDWTGLQSITGHKHTHNLESPTGLNMNVLGLWELKLNEESSTASDP